MAWALVGPIPGRASSSSLGAVLMLTSWPGASFALVWPVFSVTAFSADVAFSGIPAADGIAAGTDVAAAVPMVTWSLMVLIFLSLMPLTRFRSSILLYGRPAMIAFAVDFPIPGRDSRVFWSALLRSMSATAVFPAVPAAFGIAAGTEVAAAVPMVTWSLMALIFLSLMPLTRFRSSI